MQQICHAETVRVGVSSSAHQMVHLFDLEGDPAAGENKTVLLRLQDTLLPILLASSTLLGDKRADGVSHIIKRRGGI